MIPCVDIKRMCFKHNNTCYLLFNYQCEKNDEFYILEKLPSEIVINTSVNYSVLNTVKNLALFNFSYLKNENIMYTFSQKNITFSVPFIFWVKRDTKPPLIILLSSFIKENDTWIFIKYMDENDGVCFFAYNNISWKKMKRENNSIFFTKIRELNTTINISIKCVDIVGNLNQTYFILNLSRYFNFSNTNINKKLYLQSQFFLFSAGIIIIATTIIIVIFVNYRTKHKKIIKKFYELIIKDDTEKIFEMYPKIEKIICKRDSLLFKEIRFWMILYVATNIIIELINKGNFKLAKEKFNELKSMYLNNKRKLKSYVLISSIESKLKYISSKLSVK